MNDECNEKIKETKILYSLRAEEEQGNLILKEDIRKMNKNQMPKFKLQMLIIVQCSISDF